MWKVMFFLSALVLAGCADNTHDAPGSSAASEEISRADSIISRAIATHGGSALDQSVVEFDFRGEHFRIRHDDGKFSYARTYRDTLGRTLRDVMTNDSTYRLVNGRQAEITAEDERSLISNVNATTYLALVPYFLDAPAVRNQYIRRDTVRGEAYHLIEVTFQQQGGGRDWQDRYLYWFSTDDAAMEYFAYGYGLAPGEEPGSRFREAFNVRRRGGIRFADYRNYSSDTLGVDNMARYGDLLEAGELRLVSTVELDSIRVRRLD